MNTPEKKQGQPSSALSVVLWIVSLGIGFCFVPYLDIFPTGHFEPDDFSKPLIFGFMASLVIRLTLGALLGSPLK